MACSNTEYLLITDCVMRNLNADEVNQPDFRSKLAAKILKNLNDELIKTEGHGDIEDLFFTAFMLK